MPHVRFMGWMTLALWPLLGHAQESTPRLATPSAIASDQYESTPTFTPDGREMYFMQADPLFTRYRLMWSKCVNGEWSQAERAPFGLDVQEADPGLTPDGKRLYFISTRQDPKADQFDIWYVERTSSGVWGEPVHLPEPVNSSSSELLPRADKQGRLYFGSDRPGGLGKGDIYVAEQARDGKWSVRNVGPPVNSAAFEYEAEISQDGTQLVAVIDRGDRSHLYRFERAGDRWVERGRVPASPNVFQVGPLLSPKADRLLFAQATGKQSGELFRIDLSPRADSRWPPCSGRKPR